MIRVKDFVDTHWSLAPFHRDRGGVNEGLEGRGNERGGGKGNCGWNGQ